MFDSLDKFNIPVTLVMEGENMTAKEMKAPMDNTTVILKRTFNQKVYDKDLNVIGIERFWRVMAPSTHKNYQSDLSLAGLKDWGIIC